MKRAVVAIVGAYGLVLFATVVGTGVGALLAGCSEESSRKAVEARIYTVEHDGHRFVVVAKGRGSEPRAILHHPDCPCGKGSRP